LIPETLVKNLKIIINDNNFFKFLPKSLSFPNRDLYEMVIEMRPWILNGGVLFVDRWPESGEWKDANLSTFPCWVGATCIPLQLIANKNIKKIAN